MAFGASIKKAFSKKRIGGNLKAIGRAFGTPKSAARGFHTFNKSVVQPIGRPLGTVLSYVAPPAGMAVRAITAASEVADRSVGLGRTIGARAVKDKRGGRVKFAGNGPAPRPSRSDVLAPM